MSTSDTKYIVIIDDDDEVAAEIQRAFQKAGYQVKVFRDGNDVLWDCLDHGNLPDLAIVDLALPSTHGFQVSEELKARGDIPIIFVSSDQNRSTIIQGIRDYAEDYVVKPVDIEELVARAERILKRFDESRFYAGPAFSYANFPPYDDGRLTIDLAHAFVRFEHNHAQSLTPTEIQLLGILITHEGEVVPSATLISRVWQYGEMTEESLRVHMHRLRRKIEPDYRNPRYIHTVRGIGYQFISPGKPADDLPVKFVSSVE